MPLNPTRTHLTLRLLLRLSVLCSLVLFVYSLPSFAQESSGTEDIDQLVVEKTDVSRNPVDLMTLVQRPDEDLLIFNLIIGKSLLSDAFLTYEDLDTGKYYFHLTDFLTAVEFPIDVNDDAGTASGWFLRENNTFQLDLKTNAAIIAGSTKKLSKGDIERHEDGIYVSLKTLESWFPLTLEIDYSELAVVIKSLQPLPIEIRKQRDGQRNSLGNEVDKPQLPLYSEKAPFVTLPFANFSTETSFNDTESGGKELSSSYTGLITGIVANQDVELSINDVIDDNDRPDIRLSLGP